MSIHNRVCDEVVPMIGKADNPGLIMREWLVNEGLDPKDVREVCVALAIAYRGALDQRNQYEQLYRETRDRR